MAPQLQSFWVYVQQRCCPFGLQGKVFLRKYCDLATKGSSSLNAPVSIVGRQVGFLERSAELM